MKFSKINGFYLIEKLSSLVVAGLLVSSFSGCAPATMVTKPTMTGYVVRITTAKVEIASNFPMKTSVMKYVTRGSGEKITELDKSLAMTQEIKLLQEISRSAPSKLALALKSHGVESGEQAKILLTPLSVNTMSGTRNITMVLKVDMTIPDKSTSWSSTIRIHGNNDLPDNLMVDEFVKELVREMVKEGWFK